MEVLNGVVSQPISCKFTAHNHTSFPASNNLSFSRVCFPEKSSLRKIGNNLCVYQDEGHMKYYYSPVCGEGKGMRKGKGNKGGLATKKRIKLLKGLTEDLATLCDLGFDCDQNHPGLIADHNSEIIIAQAAEVLLAQLKLLRAAEEEQKMKEKREQKKCKNGDCESSSSSESESSDSECDEVVDLKQMRGFAQQGESKGTQLRVVEQLTAKLSLPPPEGSGFETLPLNSDETGCNMILDAALSKDASIEVLSSETSNMKQLHVGSSSNLAGVKSEGKRIEVCMGGKCKKQGAPMLMEEIEKALGNEGVVVGCKCMGKCKSAPNVKVSSGLVGVNMVDDSSRTPSNHVYIGVGLEDVGLIVANYLEEAKKNLSVTVAGGGY